MPFPTFYHNRYFYRRSSVSVCAIFNVCLFHSFSIVRLLPHFACILLLACLTVVSFSHLRSLSCSYSIFIIPSTWLFLSSFHFYKIYEYTVFQCKLLVFESCEKIPSEFE